jgi:predicted transcriptional regulator
MERTSTPQVDDMARLSIRVPDSTLRRLDALAGERGIGRSRVVRQLLEGALAAAPAGIVAPETPDEDELLDLLADRAREGHVAAITALLNRQDEPDPRARAMEALQQLARERQ